MRHIGGSTGLLRRAAALRLVQMSTSNSLAEAAAFLGIAHRKIFNACTCDLATTIDHQSQKLTPGICRTASLTWHRQPGHLYLRKGIAMDPIDDWSNCGLATVRAVLAEAIAAEFAHSQDPAAIWHAGSNAATT